MKLKTTVTGLIMMACLVCIPHSVKAASPYIKIQSGTTEKITVGKTTNIKASVKRKKRKITYKSGNKKIATVTSKGKIRGKKYGKTYIYVKAKGCKTKKIKVYVRKKATGIKITSGSWLTFSKLGQTSQIKGYPTPKGKVASNTLKYQSQNTKVATVTSKGVVKAVGPGYANIKVSTSSKNGKVYSELIAVYVNIPVTGIQAPGSATVDIWESKNLGISVLPTNATNQELQYTVEDPTIACISSEGVLTGLHEGTTKIQVTSAANGNLYKVISVTVTNKNNYQWPDGVSKTYKDGKTIYSLDVNKLSKVEIIFRDKNSQYYAYTIKDIKNDFKQLKDTTGSTTKNGIRIVKNSTYTATFQLLSTGEVYKVTFDYSRYAMEIEGDYTDDSQIRFNQVEG